MEVLQGTVLEWLSDVVLSFLQQLKITGSTHQSWVRFLILWGGNDLPRCDWITSMAKL